MEEDGDVDEETAFTLLDDLATPMSVAQVTACAHKFCDFWLEDAASFDNMLQWISVKFEIDAAADFEWEEFDISFETHRVRIQHINTYSEQITDETLQTRLGSAMHVLYSARTLVMQTARLTNLVCPDNNRRSLALPPEERKGSLAPEHLYIHDKVKLNSFQNLFLHLRERLEGMQYRRAKGFFYVRKVIPCGIKSQAFTQAISVRDFIKKNTSHGSDWEAWRWCTDSRANFEHGVEYLTDRSLPEAPDLKEKRTLRSFGGDALGRGSGIYDAACDVFFPYCMQDDWDNIAARATGVRRRLGWGGAFTGKKQLEFACKAPASAEVCVRHFEESFPYDTHRELGDILYGRGELEGDPNAFKYRWRNAMSQECRKGCVDLTPRYPGLATLLAEKLPLYDSEADWSSSKLGLSWSRVAAREEGEGMDEDAEGDGEDRFGPWIRVDPSLTGPWQERFDTSNVFFEDEMPPDLTCNHYVVDQHDPNFWWVPHRQPRMRVRVVLSKEELFGACPELELVTLPSNACVRHEDRYFRLDHGRAWGECYTPEVETIYRCQKFTEFDRLMLFALKGRLLYSIGTMDKQVGTLMFEGIGGCGKSTLLQSSKDMWPMHLQGIMSSNIEAKFGMSNLVGSAVIFCSEVTTDLQIPHEEWKAANSGEAVTLAVKHKEPIVVDPFEAPMLWAGNQYPSCFPNTQGETSRRLPGVIMEYPVQPRDGSIYGRIMTNIGALLRKEVLAHRELFMRMYVYLDIMSDIKYLPPAFEHFYVRSLCINNPVEHFLRAGTTIEKHEQGTIDLKIFKQLLYTYLQENNMRTPKSWNADVYRTAFANHGVQVRIERDCNGDRVDLVLGLRAKEVGTAYYQD